MESFILGYFPLDWRVEHRRYWPPSASEFSIQFMDFDFFSQSALRSFLLDRQTSESRTWTPPARVLFGFWWFRWGCLSCFSYTQGGGHWTVRCWDLSLSINISLSRDHGGNKNEWIMLYNSMSVVWDIRIRCLTFCLAIILSVYNLIATINVIFFSFVSFQITLNKVNYKASFNMEKLVVSVYPKTPIDRVY